MDKLTFNQPASKWEEAWPIGNGRMGAMIFGESENGNRRERIQLNEDSIWYGGPQDRINPDALPSLPEIRKLILEGRIPEAENLMVCAMTGTPQNERVYQTAGDLWINFMDSDAKPQKFERKLNLQEGLAEICYQTGDTKIHKEYLASYPAQVIAIRFKAEGSRKLSFTAMFTRGHFSDSAGRLGHDTVYLKGNGGASGIHFLLAVKAVAKDGSVHALGENIIVRDTSEVVLYLAMETSFYHQEKYQETALERLQTAANAGYEAIRKAHVEDYRKLFDTVDFHLKGDGAYLDYTENYFRFGRYLSIASSRPGSQAANLQGIWNEEMSPPWDSKYTININTEMNYWHAETCNLSECHIPFFDLLKRMHARGKETAEKMYGCRGFVAHHNTDIWADCAPQDVYIPATYWVMGGAWMCTHIWNHYIYTGDQDFLKDMYPVLEDAVLFFHDYLIEDKGELVTCPSVSPENTYIMKNGVQGRVCSGAAMDNQILRDLFNGFIKASEILGTGQKMCEETKVLLNRLPVNQIGRHGQIMEWREDYEEAEPGHRHISQLYALYPSGQITLDETPELAAACENTLERRLAHGGGHTGWSCAWIVGLYARLGKGDKAWEVLQKLYKNSTFPNLMDNHPMGDGHVFQIDGNFGATAAIAEMLMQSNEERVLLLPALPEAWKSGIVKGLVMAGGGIVDLCWENNKIISCRIKAVRELNTVVIWENTKQKIHVMEGEYLQVV